MSFCVVPAPPDAVQFVKFLDHLQDENRHALGFLPFEALRQAIELERVFLCYENDEPAGYVIHGPAKKHGKIYQVCVAEDARRIEHGTALIEAVRAVMNHARAHTLTLHCADDLPANDFWKTLGFAHIGRRCKRKDGSRWQNRYQVELPAKQADLLAYKAQLKADGLTNLQRLLVKGDIRLGSVPFRRKRQHGHTLYLPPGIEPEGGSNGTR